MKKIIMTIIACMGLFGTLHAQVSDVNVGYCGGEVASKGTIKCPDANSWVSAAIYIPAGTLNTYAGNQINGINAGLSSKLKISELKVWLRSSLDGENLVEKTITTTSDPKLAKGWNEVKFDTPWDIPADSENGVYVGFSFYQEMVSYALATLSQPYKDGLFIQFGDGEWEDHSDEGTLCVEALVSGDNLPKVNAALTALSVPEVYIIERGTMEIGGTVQNMATHTITGFDVNAIVNGEKVGTAHVDSDIEYSKSGQFSVTLPLGITEVGDGTGEVTVSIDNINEGTDENPTDNTLTATFQIVKHDFKRRIFVEEFTTESCPNCPRVATYMHEALDKDEFKDDVIAVCHHSGFGVDWLTINSDSSYLWLFNSNGTYAPAMSVDRDPRGDTTPVWCPASSGEMEGIWRLALAEPALVSLNISAVVDEENENHIKVTVEGAKSIGELCDNPRITVFVVEDNINARSQAGSNGSYVHQHVNRAVNATWGDPVEFNGDEYEYTCEFNLASSWKREDLQIVAMIANFNSEDATDCIVKNANSVSLKDIETGVGSISADEDCETAIYTLSGVRVSGKELAPGLYIRKNGSKTEKFIVR